MTILFVIVALLMSLGYAEAATRYAGPSGSGTSCTNSSTPCTVATALSQIVCGDTLVLQNGTYTGTSQMLLVNSSHVGGSGLVCSSGTRVTVQAETAGSVLIDRANTNDWAVVLDGAAYWTVTGINAKRAWSPFEIRNSDNIILQNVIGYDCPNNNINCQVLIVQNSSNTLVEDSAFFGLATETVLDYGNNSNVTYRRLWIRTEGWSGAAGGPSVSNQWNYTTDNHPTPSLMENIIITSAPARAGTIDYIDNTARHNAQSPYIRQYGHIVYAGSGATQNLSFLMRDGGGPACNGYLIQDTLVHHNGTNYAPISNQANDASNGCDSPGISGQRQNTRVTAIRGTTASNLNGAAATNVVEATTVGGTGFDYQGTSNTAKLCFRYVDGVYTSTKLWPWPMDDRIKAAIAENGSTALAGTSGTGYAANTVTSEIVSLFGSLPSACSTSFTPAFPVASDFPSVSVRDDFNRTASTLGTSWTELLPDTFSAANAAVAPSTGGAFARAIYNDTQLQTSHEVYATWNTLPTNTGGFNTMLSFAGTDLTANNQYRIRFSATSGSNSQVDVVRIDSGGSSTTIMSAVDLGIEAVDGNSFGVRVSGSTISVYWKWTDGVWYRIGEFTDSNLPASGGVYGGISGVGGVVIDDWGAGPFVDQPTQEPPTPPASVGASRFGTTFPGVR